METSTGKTRRGTGVVPPSRLEFASKSWHAHPFEIGAPYARVAVSINSDCTPPRMNLIMHLQMYTVFATYVRAYDQTLS